MDVGGLSDPYVKIALMMNGKSYSFSSVQKASLTIKFKFVYPAPFFISILIQGLKLSLS